MKRVHAMNRGWVGLRCQCCESCRPVQGDRLPLCARRARRRRLCSPCSPYLQAAGPSSCSPLEQLLNSAETLCTVGFGNCWRGRGRGGEAGREGRMSGGGVSGAAWRNRQPFQPPCPRSHLADSQAAGAGQRASVGRHGSLGGAAQAAAPCVAAGRRRAHAAGAAGAVGAAGAIHTVSAAPSKRLLLGHKAGLGVCRRRLVVEDGGSARESTREHEGARGSMRQGGRAHDTGAQAQAPCQPPLTGDGVARVAPAVGAADAVEQGRLHLPGPAAVGRQSCGEWLVFGRRARAGSAEGRAARSTAGTAGTAAQPSAGLTCKPLGAPLPRSSRPAAAAEGGAPGMGTQSQGAGWEQQLDMAGTEGEQGSRGVVQGRGLAAAQAPLTATRPSMLQKLSASSPFEASSVGK